jgi:hypothetical protein
LQKAVDDAGNSMLENQPTYNSFNVNSDSVWSVVVNLDRPDRRSTRIAQLKGSVQAAIETRSETWNVPNILKVHDLSHDFGDCTFSINSLTAMRNLYVLRVSGVRLSSAPDGTSLGIGQIELFDAEGRALASRGMGGGGGPDHMIYTMTFDSTNPAQSTGQPARLVWKVPVSTKTVDIPFDFSNLPLP